MKGFKPRTWTNNFKYGNLLMSKVKICVMKRIYQDLYYDDQEENRNQFRLYKKNPR